MKHRICLISILAFAAIATSAIPAQTQVQPPPFFTIEVIDYPTTIQPGASYNIHVRVTRPSGMVLPAWATAGDTRWEIRVYFYDGLNCYTQGEWVTIGGTPLYEGWWKWRFKGDSWTAAMADTREFTIPVTVVEHPRPTEDIQRGMTEIPVGGEVRLKVRLRLRGMTYTENADNFEYYGQTFQVGALPIELSDAGYWQIDYDTIKTGIKVTEAAGVFEIPLIAKVGIGVVVIIAIIAAALVMMKRRKAEIPPVPPPTPTSA
jgi:hypothetical protein